MSATKVTAVQQSTLDHPINTKTTVEWVLLTPDLAREWLGENHGNRNMRRAVAAQYARDMAYADWMTTGDPIRFDWNGRLIDGQHRCEGVILSNESIYVLVIRGLDPQVQNVIDTNARRTATDALRFNGYEHNVAEIAGAARINKARELGLLTSALSAHTPTPMTNSEILEWVAKNPEITNAAALARRTYKTIGAAPSALTYCIWILEKIDPSAAVDFFTTTAEFATNGKHDPRATLLRAFNNLRESKMHMTAGIQLLYIFRSWNAWRAGENLAVMRSTLTSAAGVKGIQIPEPK